jgi:hypothetical protein
MRKALKSILSAYAVVLAIIAVIVLLTASIVLLPSSNLPTMKFGESKDLNNFDAREVNCLALNIYHEARGSNLADKIAVADVPPVNALRAVKVTFDEGVTPMPTLPAESIRIRSVELVAKPTTFVVGK